MLVNTAFNQFSYDTTLYKFHKRLYNSMRKNVKYCIDIHACPMYYS